MPRDKPPHPLFTPTSPLPWLVALPLILLLLPDGSRSTLQVEYNGVMTGEIYRLWTGHLVHLGVLHTLINVAALLGIGLICRAETLRYLNWWFAALVPPLVSLALLLMPPGFSWYVGLSGALHGAAFYLGLAGLKTKDRAAVALGAAVLVKILVEALLEPASGWEAMLGGPVLTVAHAWGVVVASLLFIPASRFAAHQHRL